MTTKQLKNIITTGLIAELVALISAVFSTYKIQLIYEDYTSETYWGIQSCLRCMWFEFIQFWPIFLLIAVATVVALVVSFVFFNKNTK